MVFSHQEAVVVIAEDGRGGKAAGSIRASVAPSRLPWPLKKRMNCFGYMVRDSGHRRVPEPPDKITGTIIRCSSCKACTLACGRYRGTRTYYLGRRWEAIRGLGLYGGKGWGFSALVVSGGTHTSKYGRRDELVSLEKGR